jgi:hypothetical protein
MKPMKKLVLTDDWYMRIVLTVIAFALVLIALNPWISPVSVRAAAESGPMTVVIDSVEADAFDNVAAINAEITKPVDVRVVKGTW